MNLSNNKNVRIYVFLYILISICIAIAIRLSIERERVGEKEREGGANFKLTTLLIANFKLQIWQLSVILSSAKFNNSTRKDCHPSSVFANRADLFMKIISKHSMNENLHGRVM